MEKTAKIIPATERNLKNHISFSLTVKNALTFTYRALLKTIHNPETWMDITIMPIMFALLFTYLFGGAIAGSIKAYLPTIIPGILIQTLVTSTGTAGTNLREDTDKSISNRFKSMPISRMAPLVGTLTADLVRYAIAGIIVFGMGYILGFRPAAGLGAVIISILFMMMIAWCLSWLFSFLAMSVKSVTAASTTAMLIMFPLSFLSNAFVPTNTLPSALKFFANHINPVSYAVSAVRHILKKGTIDGNFWAALIAAAVLLLTFVPLTYVTYKKKG